MEDIVKWTADDIVRKAEEIAAQLTRDKLKTGQIRNFYSAITRMRTDFSVGGEKVSDTLKMDISMLKPKLAYAAGRQTAVRATFYPVMKSAVDGIVNSGYHPAAMRNFFMLVESIVAYHKFYGGE